MHKIKFIIFSFMCLFWAASTSEGYAASELTLLKDFSDSDPNQHYELTNFITVGSVMFFRAELKIDGYVERQELWKSNGTPEGTVLVKSFDEIDHISESIGAFTSYKGLLYFRGYDDTYGAELWKSDGTEAGTTIVKDLYTGSGDGFRNSGCCTPEMTVSNNILFFKGTEGYGDGLCRSNGTSAGTYKVKGFDVGPEYLTDAEGTLFFAAGTISGPARTFTELFKSDGTEAGTVLVKDIYPGLDADSSSSPRNLMSVDRRVFFSATDADHGRELWRSNGLEASTEMVADVANFTIDSDPDGMTHFGLFLMFSAYDEISGRELMASPLGYGVNIIAINDPIWDPSEDSDPQYLTVSNDTLYFAATRNITGHNEGRELWKSDGTAAGTEPRVRQS